MTLVFNLPPENAAQPLQIEVNRLVIAGWTGRDAHAIEHHIGELEAIGVPRPSAVPLFYRVAANQLSQAGTVQVVGDGTSGEVEPFLFFHAGEFFVSIASDHTDRALEAHSIALSKQVCPKPVARNAWRLADVRDHWDELVLRSWIEEDGESRLYQEGTLAALRGPADLLARYGADNPAPAEGFAMTCGTVGAIGGIRPSASFRMELLDARLGRSITHAYRCVALPVIA
ncbi:DUF2848 domain-containing protein [Polaromonas sp.]|uniref:DUF2848 domain-containing protein n=1 Tax=Polaromonas sp. TaxID=1869339 RepID=UPI002FCC2D6B